MTNGPCVSEEALVALLELRLEAQALEALHAHLDTCPSCLALLQAAAGPYFAERRTRSAPAAGADPAANSGAPPAGLPVQDEALGDTWLRERGAAPADFVPPTTFDEYRVVRPLGRGAMGQVYLGHDTLLDRPVAIKFLAPLEPDRAERERFLVEARAIARVQHPNVVTLYRVGEVEGHPFLISEFIGGISLDQLARPVSDELAQAIALGLARGLGAAHAGGVLHRDIKPANAILAHTGEVKLLDFGLAKLLEVQRGFSSSIRQPEGVEPARGKPDAAASASPALTADGALLGTPLFLSAEMWRGEPATPRSDLYSLGALLFFLCSDQTPHRGASLRELRRAVEEGAAPPLAPVAPQVDPRFAAIVDRCLRRDPGERFSGCAELCEALESLSRGPRAIPADRPARSRPWQRMSLVVPAALILGVGVLGALGGLKGAFTRLGRFGPAKDMALIPAGTFSMGSSSAEMEQAYKWCTRLPGDPCVAEHYQREQPIRQVRLSPFYLDVTEVTNERFAAWLNRQPGLTVDRGRLVRDGGVLLLDLYPTYGQAGITHLAAGFRVLRGYEHKPVTQVTWDGAQSYCKAQGKRLPTEAEWEYAARGTQGTRFPWGDEEPECEGVVFARVRGQACAALRSGPQDVGTAAVDRSPQGVFDLAGNVAEWVLDPFGERYAPCGPACTDPVAAGGPADGGPEFRVLRGGDWYAAAVLGRAAGRGRWQRDRAAGNIGFRCALSAGH